MTLGVRHGSPRVGRRQSWEVSSLFPPVCGSRARSGPQANASEAFPCQTILPASETPEEYEGGRSRESHTGLRTEKGELRDLAKGVSSPCGKAVDEPEPWERVEKQGATRLVPSTALPAHSVLLNSPSPGRALCSRPTNVPLTRDPEISPH